MKLATSLTIISPSLLAANDEEKCFTSLKPFVGCDETTERKAFFIMIISFACFLHRRQGDEEEKNLGKQ